MIYIAFPFLLIHSFFAFVFVYPSPSRRPQTLPPTHSGMACFHARSDSSIWAPPGKCKATNSCKCRTRLFDITHTVSIPFCLSIVSPFLWLPPPPPPHLPPPPSPPTMSYILTHNSGFHWLSHFRTRWILSFVCYWIEHWIARQSTAAAPPHTPSNNNFLRNGKSLIAIWR